MAEKTVTREDLYEAVRRRAGLSRSDAASLVAQVLEEITACLERGETVRFSSFGSFIVRQKGERIGRNPRTGKPAPISRPAWLWKSWRRSKRRPHRNYSPLLINEAKRRLQNIWLNKPQRPH
jgi:integration host factor subunit alpha